MVRAKVQSRKQTSLGLPRSVRNPDTQPTEPQPREIESTGTVLIGPRARLYHLVNIPGPWGLAIREGTTLTPLVRWTYRILSFTNRNCADWL